MALINTNTIINMLRYKTKTRPGLVALICTTSGQETERVHSYNPGALIGKRKKFIFNAFVDFKPM